MQQMYMLQITWLAYRVANKCCTSKYIRLYLGGHFHDCREIFLKIWRNTTTKVLPMYPPSHRPHTFQYLLRDSGTATGINV